MDLGRYMISPSNLWRKLKGRKYRNAFVTAQLKQGVPFQIRALRKKRQWSQERLAKEAGLTQGVISRYEDPDYGNLTFNIVSEIANGLDMAFVGKFVPFSELASWFAGLSEQAIREIPTFDEEEARREQSSQKDSQTEILIALGEATKEQPVAPQELLARGPTWLTNPLDLLAQSSRGTPQGTPIQR